MPYCSRCGVEVHPEADSCPLCHAAIQKFFEEPSPGRSFPPDQLPPSVPSKMTPREKRRLITLLLGFGHLIPLAVCLAVDLVLNRRITWAVYSSISLVGTYLTINLALRRRGHPLIWCIALVVMGSFWGAYQLGAASLGFLRLGFVISLALALCSSGVFESARRAGVRGANIPGFILFGLGFFCLLVDLILVYFFPDWRRLSWSLVVVAITFPTGFLLLTIHYFGRREGSKLRRFFHI